MNWPTVNKPFDALNSNGDLSLGLIKKHPGKLNMFLISEDQKLLKQIAEGKEMAFRDLYRKYSSAVYGLACRMMKSREQADEITQEVWLKVIKKADQFKGEKTARSWLLQITKNTCLDELRSSPNWVELNPELLTEESDESAPTPEFMAHPEGALHADFANQEDLTKAKECLQKLSDRQRASIVLFYFEEKPLEVLGQDLNLKVNAVKALLFRARQNLVRCVKGGSI